MIAKGTASKEAQEFKRYIGVCPVTVAAVNPTKAEYEKLFNTTLEEAPVYVTDTEDANGKSYKNIRINIILKPVVEGLDIPLVTMPLFVTNQKAFGATSGKYQIIDKYGRTAWATQEDIESKRVPVYSNGKKADISEDYRIAFSGEETLTKFLRTFLGIPEITIWDNDSQSRIPNNAVSPDECECRLDVAELQAMAKGDFSSIKSYIDYWPANKIKVCLGVRTNAETGKQYQTVYTRRFASNVSSNYTGFKNDFEKDALYAQAHGRIVNTEFSSEKVHEYTITPTVFTPSTPTEEMPFSSEGFDDSDPFA